MYNHIEQEQHDRVNQIIQDKIHEGYNGFNQATGGYHNTRVSPFSAKFLEQAEKELLKQKQEAQAIDQKEYDYAREHNIGKNKYKKLYTKAVTRELDYRKQLKESKLQDKLKVGNEQLQKLELGHKELEDDLHIQQGYLKQLEETITILEDEYNDISEAHDVLARERLDMMETDRNKDDPERYYDLGNRLAILVDKGEHIAHQINNPDDGFKVQLQDKQAIVNELNKKIKVIKKTILRKSDAINILNDKLKNLEANIEVQRSIKKDTKKLLKMPTTQKRKKIQELEREIKLLQAKKRAVHHHKKGGVSAGIHTELHKERSWQAHLRHVRKENPDMPYKKVQALASSTYHNKALVRTMKHHKAEAKKVHHKGAGKKTAHQKAAHHNPWIMHVQAYRAKHPHLSYKEVLMQARKSYK
jgi:chromosome segregation ATPase